LHRPHGKKDLVHVEAMPNFEKSMPGDYDISIVDTALKPAPKSQKTSTAPSEPTAPPARNPIAAGARTVAGVLDTAIGGIQSLPGAFAAEVGYAGAKGLEGLGLVKPGVAERGREANL
jgi:hypothetical protein